ncbi:MAG: hypothetical protein IKH78_07370 [Ruminococcus sp.]|nr:hypothetical protein [Ruminococcus sp.]
MDNNYNNDPNNPAGQGYGAAPDNGQYGNQGYGGAPNNGQYGNQGYGGYPNYGQSDFYGLQDPYANPQVEESGSNAIASLVVSLINIILFCVPVLGICMGLIGLILGIKGLKSDKKGISIAGTVISGLTLALATVVFIGFIISLVKRV